MLTAFQYVFFKFYDTVSASLVNSYRHSRSILGNFLKVEHGLRTDANGAEDGLRTPQIANFTAKTVQLCGSISYLIRKYHGD